MKRAAFILVLGLLAAGCGGSSSGSGAENGPIALSSQGGLTEKHGLFLREPDGKLRRLTTARDLYPAFSHDGKRIAYVHTQRGLVPGTGLLMVADADGNNAHQVGDLVAGALQIAWSPDDGSLVYSSAKNGLWTVGADGNGAKRIFKDLGDASWSPDGRIVLARPAHALTTMNADGTDVRELLRPKTPPKAILPDTYSVPAWSPDGKRIAYVLKVWLPSKTFLFPTTIETVNPDGSGREVVTKVFDSTLTTLSWSPDGKIIAFTDNRDDVIGLWQIPFVGGEAKLLIDSTHYFMPSWGPAGT